GAFAAAVPRLWNSYRDTLDRVYEAMPHLPRNFLQSVYPAAAFNLGPDVICKAHLDGRNLSYGQCAITALGSYDFTKGGHLYAWELGLIIQFPPGSTILVPSACVTHGNTPIQPGECRASFTQYCAGPLFQWVSYGCRTGTQLLKDDPAAKKASDTMGAARWLEGLALYSKVSELHDDLHTVFLP
ncbi:hypothetical protein DENSPDRAFT_788153, partial [Dentipellis sp. KUC8613]